PTSPKRSFTGSRGATSAITTRKWPTWNRAPLKGVEMGRGTVLVIDDERDLVNLVRYNLECEGYEVLGALDGESGLNLAFTRSPDLILLDRMMPGPDGVEVCRRLRGEGRTAHVPVIMLTAKAA